jgi:translation initiation factor 2B subunit (eIF-2B alpha/beta/delta family)
VKYASEWDIIYTNLRKYLGFDNGVCSEAQDLVELKSGTAAFDLLVAKEKENGLRCVKLERGAFDKTHPDLVENNCTNHGELSVLLERGAFDKTHPDLVENICTNHGELAVLLERGAFDKTHPDLVEKNCTNHGQRNVKLGRGAFDKTHPELVKYKCDNFGQLAVIKKIGAHNPDNMQRMNAIRSEKGKKRTAGYVEFKSGRIFLNCRLSLNR